MHALLVRIRESFWFCPAVLGVVAIVAAQLLVTLDREVLDGRVPAVPFLDALSAGGGRSILTTIGTAMLTVAGTSFSITISVLATTSSTYGPRRRAELHGRPGEPARARGVHVDVPLRDGRAADGAHDRRRRRPVRPRRRDPRRGPARRARRGRARLLHPPHRVEHADHVAAAAGADRPACSGRRGLPGRRRRSTDDRPRRRARGRVVRGPGCGRRLRAVGGVAGPDGLGGPQRPSGRRRRDPGPVRDPGRRRRPRPRGRGSRPTVDAATARTLRAAVVLGTARTPVQDVEFALQQLVEIAVRGLASGSNDPYTAVSALDMATPVLVPLWRDRAAVTALLGPDGARGSCSTGRHRRTSWRASSRPSATTAPGSRSSSVPPTGWPIGSSSRRSRGADSSRRVRAPSTPAGTPG